MKKTITKIMCAILLMAFAMSAIACGSDTVYDELAEGGYTVRVRFDPNGTTYGTQNVTIVEVYDANNIVTIGDKTGIRSLDPEDPARGKSGEEGSSSFKYDSMVDEKTNARYFMLGWYTNRTEIAPGQYEYEKRWDFEKDLVDPRTLENGELTLYAVWLPFFTYEIYLRQEDGSFLLNDTLTDKLNLNLPEWKEGKNGKPGKWDMNDLKKIQIPEGKKAVAYYDETLTQPVAGDAIDGRASFVDYQNGTVSQSVIRVYITLTDATA